MNYRNSWRSNVQGSNLDEMLAIIAFQHLGHDILSSNQDVRDRALRAALLSGGIDLGALNGLGLGGRGGRDIEDLIVEDVVRRANSIAQLTNSLVPVRQTFSEVHPKLCVSGKYAGQVPRDFPLPMRIDQLVSLENASLDRILSAYELPVSSYSSHFSGINNRGDDRAIKLHILLQFLGVNIEDLDTRSSGNLSGLSSFSSGLSGSNRVGNMNVLSALSELSNLSRVNGLSGFSGLGGLNGGMSGLGGLGALHGISGFSGLGGMSGNSSGLSGLGGRKNRLGDPGTGRRGMSDE